jgi:thymidylate synthase
MISDDFQIGPNGAYEHVGNELDLQYQDLLQHILDNGVEKKDRTGTGTLSVFGYQIRHNMKDGFPLLTTKKVHFKSVVTELLWFLRGDTNIKYLVDNNCHIWDGDAYKNWFKKGRTEFEEFADPMFMSEDALGEEKFHKISKEWFIEKIKTDDEFAKKWGELGPVYGKQWRSWKVTTNDEQSPNFENTETSIDQIANSINLLKTDPDSRRNRVNAWNVGELDQMVLPPCHTDFQVYTRELSLEERGDIYETNFKGLKRNKSNEDFDKLNIPTRAISLMWNQRSVDTALGWPFNVASYGLLLELLGKMVNMIPDDLICNLGDVHLYVNHLEGAKEQISRTPYELPKLNINTEFWPTENGSCGEGPVDALAVLRSFSNDNFCKCLLEEDIQLYNYQSHPKIYFPLSN